MRHISDGLPNFSVYWAGWKTNLYELAKNGWTVNMEHSVYDQTWQLAINNTMLKNVGITNKMPDEFIQRFSYAPDTCRGLRFENNNQFPTLQLQYLSFKIAINIVGSTTVGMRFSKVEHIYPYPHKESEIDLGTLLGGGYVEASDSGIIVPDYSIPELMKLIKEKQAPRQQEIRDRLKKETNPKIKQEARIISLDTNIASLAQPGIRAALS